MAPPLKVLYNEFARSFSSGVATPFIVLSIESLAMRLATDLPALPIANLPRTVATPAAPPVPTVVTKLGVACPPSFATCSKNPKTVGSSKNCSKFCMPSTAFAANSSY